MNHRYKPWLIVIAAAAVAPLCAVAQTMNVKPGGWEITNKLEWTPPANLPADKAAQMARTMNQPASTDKSCVKKEDLDKPMLGDMRDCAVTYSARSSARYAGTFVCNRKQGSSTGEFDVQAPTPETVSAVFRTKVTTGPQAGASFTMKSTGRFVSASCKGFDD